MAVRLRSASINQTLRLAFKASALSLLLYWLRSDSFAFGQSLVFVLFFWIFYFRPGLNNGHFIPSALAMLVIPFFLPILPSGAELLFVVSWGTSFFLLLGVKNLVLVKRQKVYRVVHFGITAALGILLIEHFGFTSQALIFIAFLLTFREFYITSAGADGERTTLIATLEAFAMIEVAWILSFLSTDVLVSGAFLTLFAFIFHDTTAHKLTGTLSKQIVIRNCVLFGVLTIAVSALAARGILA